MNCYIPTIIYSICILLFSLLSVMNILEGVKASNPKPNNSNKFIIKSKPSLKEKPHDQEN